MGGSAPVGAGGEVVPQVGDPAGLREGAIVHTGERVEVGGVDPARRHHGGGTHGHQLCSFMPLRDSIAGDPRRTIGLTGDQSVTLHAHQDQHIDPDALAGVLDQPARRVWTGVRFGGQESLEWLDLYLACVLPDAISRMLVQQPAVDAGLVDPAGCHGHHRPGQPRVPDPTRQHRR
ncbi:hypothetical protein RB614_11295 [Phytohabitans sp. ZYX-F-186]|uniref:Uncharacterized protein n=1 Tax=Phytohabitans maris TaxID=3071409 RepID=A0ABU0ZFB5_9ACTN|nr:hypothetical protein [Phytohabitans sp. ZYX-F-186]MDQ7905106.1 hypothetical protein [Phytohabitans sp. ZYX-F-186]